MFQVPDNHQSLEIKTAESYLVVFELPASLGVLTFPLLVLGQSEKRYHLVRPVDIATFVNLDAISGHFFFFFFMIEA